MPRVSISISLPDELVDRVVAHFVDTGYASFSEYIRELIRNDLRQNGVGPSDGTLVKPSGPVPPMPKAFRRF